MKARQMQPTSFEEVDAFVPQYLIQGFFLGGNKIEMVCEMKEEAYLHVPEPFLIIDFLYRFFADYHVSTRGTS